MSLTQALALRRALMLGGIMAATLAAHVAATGDLHVMPIAPAIWGMLAALAALCGPRRAPWRARRLATSVALLLAGQAVAHAVLTWAPWALGLDPLHGAPAISAAALMTHGGAALGLGALIARAERLIAIALRIVAAVRERLRPPPPRRGAPPSHSLTFTALAPRWRAPRAGSCRGPPLPSG